MVGKHPRPDQADDEHKEDTHKTVDEIEEVEAPEIKEVKEEDLSRRVIKSGNRYMSKVDWASDKVRKKIKRELANDRTLTYIARCLKVSRSTLSKANKRYTLYPTQLHRINQC